MISGCCPEAVLLHSILAPFCNRGTSCANGARLLPNLFGTNGALQQQQWSTVSLRRFVIEGPDCCKFSCPAGFNCKQNLLSGWILVQAKSSGRLDSSTCTSSACTRMQPARTVLFSQFFVHVSVYEIHCAHPDQAKHSCFRITPWV